MTNKTKEINYNLKDAISELHKIYKRANNVLFNGELPEDIVIVIQSRGKRMAYGWVYTKPVWNGEEGKDLFEIGIASETLKRPYFETITTLIHEMVHISNIVKGVQDTSRNGSYHNKAFRASCESIGMEYVANEGKPHAKIGFSQVTLSTELVAKIKFWGCNQNAFTVARMDLNGTGKEKKKSNSFKWECGCGIKLRSTKPEVNIACLDCGTKFERQD